MRIIGGRDYYDVTMGVGFDDGLIYKRNHFYRMSEFLHAENNKNSKIVKKKDDFQNCVVNIESNPSFSCLTENRIKFECREKKKKYGIRSPFKSKSNDEIVLSRVVHWFCGRRYRGVRVRFKESNVFWSYESLKKFLSENILNWNENYEIYTYENWFSGDKIEIEKYFEISEDKDVMNLIIEFGLVSIVEDGFLTNKIFDEDRWSKRNWIINADILSDIEFFKVMDSQRTFQEIEMFIGNVLVNGNNKDMVGISDADRISQHGFDNWSFRKMPSKK